MSSGGSGGSSSGAVAPAGQPIELQKVNNGGQTKTINVGAKEGMSAQPASVGMGPVAIKPNGAAAPVAAPVARVEDRTFSVSGGKATFPPTDKGRSPDYATSTNCVISSKYTLITFLPKNLFEQFSNLANLYFLLVGVFQIVPQFSTTDGNPTMYQPLAFIVFVSALRAAKEDWSGRKQRHVHQWSRHSPLCLSRFPRRSLVPSRLCVCSLSLALLSGTCTKPTPSATVFTTVFCAATKGSRPPSPVIFAWGTL